MSTQSSVEEQEEAIRLFTIRDEHDNVSSVIPLRWCISQEIAQRIQDEEIWDPRLLIVISQGGIEKQRYVVPLLNMMCYIRFPSPGENVVHATVVWPGKSYSGKDILPEKVLSARFDDGQYRAAVLAAKQPHYDGLQKQLLSLYRALESTFSQDEVGRLGAEIDQLKAEAKRYEKEPEVIGIRYGFDRIKRLEEEAQLAVVVPEEMFADEPGRFRQWLMSRYNWSHRPRNECEGRLQALVGLTWPAFMFCKGLVSVVSFAILGLLLIVAALVNGATMAVLLFFGMRGMRAEFANPLALAEDGYTPKDIWRARQPSFWLSRRETQPQAYGSLYEARADVFVVLNPPVAIWFAGVGVAASLLGGSWDFLAFACGCWAGLVALFTMLRTDFVKSRLAIRRELREKQRIEAQIIAKEALRRELEELSCGSRMEATIGSLPRDRRTVSLRYQGFKAAVCKEYPR